MTRAAAHFGDDVVNQHLDAVLRASGSALRYYSMEKTREEMREAMRTALRAAAEAEREACAALCDSKTMALDHGGKEYYRPAPADWCAAAIRARGNCAEGLV